MSARLVVSVALLLGLQACSLLAPKRLIVQVRMDSTAFHRPPDPHAMATIGFEVANLGGRSAFFAGCIDPISLDWERDSAGTWHSYISNRICLDSPAYAGLELRPGEIYHSTVEWDYPSRYRLRVYFGVSPDNTNTSNTIGAPFELR